MDCPRTDRLRRFPLLMWPLIWRSTAVVFLSGCRDDVPQGDPLAREAVTAGEQLEGIGVSVSGGSGRSQRAIREAISGLSFNENDGGYSIEDPLAVLGVSGSIYRVQSPRTPSFASGETWRRPVLRQPVTIHDPDDFAIRLSVRVEAMAFNGAVRLELVRHAGSGAQQVEEDVLLGISLTKQGNTGDLLNNVAVFRGARSLEKVDLWHGPDALGFLPGERYVLTAGVQSGQLFCEMRPMSPAGREFRVALRWRLNAATRTAFESGQYEFLVRGGGDKAYAVTEIGALGVYGGTQLPVDVSSTLQRARLKFCSGDFSEARRLYREVQGAVAPAELARARDVHPDDVARWICESESQPEFASEDTLRRIYSIWPDSGRLFRLRLRRLLRVNDDRVVENLRELREQLEKFGAAPLLEELCAIVSVRPDYAGVCRQ